MLKLPKDQVSFFSYASLSTPHKSSREAFTGHSWDKKCLRQLALKPVEGSFTVGYSSRLAKHSTAPTVSVLQRLPLSSYDLGGPPSNNSMQQEAGGGGFKDPPSAHTALQLKPLTQRHLE